MRIFWKNTVKIVSASTSFASGGWGLGPQTPPTVTLTYYYNFVEFVSSTQCDSLPSKKDKMTPVHVLLLHLFALLHLFFTSNSTDFMTGGARIFFAPGHRIPYSYATAYTLFCLYACSL